MAERGRVVEALGDVWVVGAECLLLDRQRPPEEGLSLAIAAPIIGDGAGVIQDRRVVRLVPERLLVVVPSCPIVELEGEHRRPAGIALGQLLLLPLRLS